MTAPYRRDEPDAPRPHAVLDRYGIRGARVRRIRRGLVGWHWDVRSEGRRLVLRRYNPWRVAESIPYEHAVLKHLATRGQPVAVPLSALDGTTVVSWGGFAHALFTHLRGRSHRADSTQRAAERGRLLAELHRDTRPLVRLGPRPGFEPLARYFDRPRPPGWRSMRDTIRDLGRADAALAARLMHHHRRVSRALARRPATLPRTVVHGDFSAWNLLWLDGRLSGVLDFDFCCPDERIADVASSSRFTPDLEAAAALVAGYASVTRLRASELDLLATCRSARSLDHIAHTVSFWASGRDDLLDELHRYADGLDAEETEEPVLREAVRDAIRDVTRGSGDASPEPLGQRLATARRSR